MSDNYTEETKPLFKLLRTEAFRFVIVRYNHYSFVQQLEKDLQARFPQRPFKILKAPEIDYKQLTEIYYELKSGFLIIEGFDDVLKEEKNDTNNPNIAQNDKRKKDITAGLNLRRDKLAQFPIALIVCVPASTGELYAKIVMEKMPDLWSFRSLILDLERKEEKREVFVTEDKIEQKVNLDDKIESVLLLDDNYIAEKRKELVRLQNLLSKTPETERDYRLTLYPQIVDVQIEIGKYDDALDSLQAWEDVAFEQDKAKIWFKKGDIFTTIGRLDKALVFFEKARINSEQKDDKVNLAVSLGRLGSTHSTLGNLDKALIYFEQRFELSQQLYKADPANVELINGLAISYSKLGETYSAMGNLKKAWTHFENFNRIEKQLNNDFPANEEFKTGLSVSYERLGSIQRNLGNLKKALFYFEDFNRLERQLSIDYPNNIEYKNNLGISYFKLGSIHVLLGNLDKALNYFEYFNLVEEELSRAYPNNAFIKNSLAVSYEKLGETHSALGNLDKALTYFKQEVVLFKQLNADYPQNVLFKYGFAVSYWKLGDFFKKKNDRDNARSYFEECEKILDELVRISPTHKGFQDDLEEVREDLKGLN